MQGIVCTARHRHGCNAKLHEVEGRRLGDIYLAAFRTKRRFSTLVNVPVLALMRVLVGPPRDGWRLIEPVKGTTLLSVDATGARKVACRTPLLLIRLLLTSY